MWIVERRIDTPADHAWQLLTDTRRWPEWGPTVRDVRLEQGDPVIAQGTRGQVRLPVLPLWLPFVVDQYEAERRCWSWLVCGVRATTHRVIGMSDPDRCIVRFEIPWFGAPYQAVCERALDRIEAMVG